MNCKVLNKTISIKALLILVTLLISATSLAQNDTIRVKNGNVLFGEIKKLRSGVISMETPYSDSDFSIDFF
jgi:hypothetical protein